MRIKTVLKNFASLILATAIAATTFSFNSNQAQAWEQGANGSHEEINKIAVSRFFNAYASNPKYINSPIDQSQTFIGNQTTSATLAASGFAIKMNSLTFDQWVIHGGFSADEPEVWACVRHFYDPLAVNGAPQLSDHLTLHAFAYPTISAKKWAFESDENPYSWRNALEYYKQAMEIPDDAQITVIKGMDFRDPDIQVSSAAEARSAYLGKAFRSLGETMHMMADITQPSHVRNDSHPAIDTDPLESNVNKDTVRMVKDSSVEPLFGKAIDSASNLEVMYEDVARLTNSSFYTDDTIYDKASGVNPRNWENPYPYPQFSDLILEKGSGPKTYYQPWNGIKVRMIQQTYTSWKLGTLWQDYIVPPSFATEQAIVLIPVAIKANTKVINSFFPTLELNVDLKQSINPSINDTNYKEFSVGTQLKHSGNTDIEWNNASLKIQYSGPGELWVESAGTARKLGNISFKQGSLEKPVGVFVGDKSYARKDLYQVKDKDQVYVVVSAGGRIFKSNKSTISAQTDITISPAEITLAPGGRQTFTVQLKGAGSSLSTWTIDEGPTGGEINNAFGIYTAPAKTGTYHVTATLNSDKTKKATAIVTVANVTITVAPPTATVAANGKQTFTAEVTGNPEKRVTWKVEEPNGGTITADGVYTAPEKGGPYHIVATSRADSNANARAAVMISTPTAPGINLSISPAEVVMLPGSTQEFRATVSGTTNTLVNWTGHSGSNYVNQPADIPVTFTASVPGDYLITLGSAADSNKRIQAKVKVVPGVWVFVNKTENSYQNIGVQMPTPIGGATMGNGSATSTNTTRTMTSKWSYTWTVPPTSLPVGQKFTGTAAVKDAGTSYNSKVAEYPYGNIQVAMVIDGSTGDTINFAAGYQVNNPSNPFLTSASKDFSLTVPTGKAGGPNLVILVSVGADAKFATNWDSTQEIGEVRYNYELRPSAH